MNLKAAGTETARELNSKRKMEKDGWMDGCGGEGL